MNATQIKNVLGSYHDDVNNLICECERRQKTESAIIRAICNESGVKSLRNESLSFAVVKKVMEKLGFAQFYADDETESYVFYNENDDDWFEVWPKYFYPKPNFVRIENFMIH